MQFVLPGPMPNPAAAEDVMSSLWGTSQTFASRISLWIVGWGDGKVHVAVAASVPKAESIAVETIGLGAAPGESGAVSGDAVIASALASGDCYCIAIVPQYRDIPLKDTSWWRQNNDPLYPLQTRIEKTPPGRVTGSVFTFRAFAKGRSRASLTVFAAGEDAHELAEGIVAQYQAVGATSRVPILQRRALRRALAGQIRRPAFTVTQGSLEVYWHPPLTQDPRRAETATLLL
jgi:hypothetical protein